MGAYRHQDRRGVLRAVLDRDLAAAAAAAAAGGGGGGGGWRRWRWGVTQRCGGGHGGAAGCVCKGGRGGAAELF